MKTILTLIVLCLMAGAVVYFGTEAPISIAPKSGVETHIENPNTNEALKSASSDIALRTSENRPVLDTSIVETPLPDPVIENTPRRETAPADTAQINTTQTNTTEINTTSAPRELELGEGESVERSVDTVTASEPVVDIKVERTEQDMAAIFAEAQKITRPEIRDQAYMNIVDYAIQNEFYSAALQAIGKIELIDLRDTARGMLAVAYARSGELETAFSIVETLEVEALKDVIRLQVIEGVTRPEQVEKSPANL